MLKHELALKLADYIVAKNENEGTNAGGSGHLSDVCLSIECIVQEEPEKDKTVVGIAYKKTVVSEFTILPDNPPYESLFRINITTDNYGNILNEGVKEYINTDDLWEMVQHSITLISEYILLKIEWLYGSNRAPFLFPPKFEIQENEKGEKTYKCTIENDFPDTEKLTYEYNNPGDLYRKASIDIIHRFGNV